MRQLLIVMMCGFALSATPATQPVELSAPRAEVFRKSEHVKVETSGKFLVIHSDGIPDHSTGDFPNRDNPNTIRKQNYTFQIPLAPKISDHFPAQWDPKLGIHVT